MYYNTIRLLKGYTEVKDLNYNLTYTEGQTIYGPDTDPEEIRRWDIKEKEQAKEELSKRRCFHKFHSLSNTWSITEYALEYSYYDEEGKFITGCDYDFAEIEYMKN